ncbi:MAG: hypothetical protein J1E29_00920 [Duncaniella sp.]|nr:hypothetical protein [Duncaniella sp.]
MSSRRQHTIALVATLLFHGGVLALIMMLYLRYDPAAIADRTWPPVDSAELLFGGEYVMIGDTPEPADHSEAPAPESADAAMPPSPQVEALDNSGKPSDIPSPALTSEQPSPVKAPAAKPQTPTGPSKAEIEAAERAKREEEARQAIANRVSFGKTGQSGQGAGKAGQPDGNANSGAASGQPGFNLNGRSIASWKTPPGAPVGSITIAVTVDRQGIVTDAVYQSGTGAAAASTEARRHCVAAARGSKFSVDLNAPALQKGTITYIFK